MYQILHVDLEVENKPWYGAVASPHCPENYIVAPGWRIDTVQDDGSITYGVTQHRYFHSKEEADASDWFVQALGPAVTIMVCHNCGFEIKWFLSCYREHFEDFLRRGGRVLDTQMGHYLLSHQTEMYPSLDEIAPQYGGTHKVDGVKILWEQGVLTADIDKDLLVEYLAGPSGDIDNTALCFYGQMQRLVQDGMWRMFLERCDGLVAYAYCEWFGLHVDMQTAMRNFEKQAAEIKRLRAELQNLLPANMPDWLEFSFGSRFHLSALVYGGPVKGRRRVSYDPPQYEKADYYCTTWGTRVLVQEHDNEPLGDGEDWERYKSGKNKGMPKVFREDTDVEKLKWQEDSFRMPGLVLLPTLPDVVREKFLGKRAEFKGAQLLCDGVTPVYSTSGDALEAIAQYAPAVRLMVSLATLEKDTGTYYKSDDGKGMLNFVGPDGIVHHSLNGTATVTGRLSSSRPNLQNLPRSDEDDAGEAKSRVKEMFTSRFGSAGKIVEVDYSALEVVMLAALTKDDKLLELLQADTDMHCYRLAFKLGEPYDEVKRKCKDASDPEHNKYKVMRTKIKTPSFADQYGATAEGIAFQTGMSVEECREFQENEMKLFPVSRGYRKVIADEVARTGSAPECIHREQNPSTGAWQVYRRGYFRAPGGTRYSFRQVPSWNKETRREEMAYKPTQMANYPYQGEAGFMMAISMGRIMRHCVANRWYDGRVCLINNVHDAAYLDVADEAVGTEAARAVRDIMADAPRYMTAIWPEYDMAHVPFPAAAEMGRSMMEKVHID